MNNRNRALLLALSLTLGGCAGTTYVPVEDRAGEAAAPPPAKPDAAEAPAESPPAAVIPHSPPSRARGAAPSPALLALLDQAHAQEQAGQMQRALSYLERAQRISPREPRVYLQLARVRLAMNDLARAAQLTERGLALSGADAETRRALQALKRTIEKRR